MIYRVYLLILHNVSYKINLLFNAMRNVLYNNNNNNNYSIYMTPFLQVSKGPYLLIYTI